MDAVTNAPAAATATSAPTAAAAPSTPAARPVAKAAEGEDKSKLIAREGVKEGDVKGSVYLSYLRANGYALCVLILALYIASFGAQG